MKTYTHVSVSNPETNEIRVSSSLVNGITVDRLGTATKEFTSDTVALNGELFFKFYRCDDSTPASPKVYTPLDVSAVSDTAVDRFVTMLMLNYWAVADLVADIDPSGTGGFENLAERLGGVVTPTNNLSSTLTMPASSSNFVEFVGCGVSSWVGANYINGGTTQRPTSVWGTRVGQVHITNTDPTSAPVNAVYDNDDAGCWNFSDFGCDGIIVYTNMAASGFGGGVGHWGQTLCVWPLLSEVLSADFACMFNNLDQSFMRNGLSFFDRVSRADTYYGWAGNYIQSIFNDWSIPVVSPLWGLSDMSLAAYLVYGTLNVSSNNYGSLQNVNKAFRFIGPKAEDNVSVISEKTARSILPLLWANECRNSTTGAGSAFPDLTDYVTNTLGYADVGAYLTACIGSTQEGYNAHLYKYILDNSLYSTFPIETQGFIYNSVDWSANLFGQPSLNGVFTDGTNNYPKYYPPAIDSFYGHNAGSYGRALSDRIEDGTLIQVDPMSTGDQTALENWLYTPSPS